MKKYIYSFGLMGLLYFNCFDLFSSIKKQEADDKDCVALLQSGATGGVFCVDFDTSMHHGFSADEYDKHFSEKNKKGDVAFFKELYEKNFLKKPEQLSGNITYEPPKIPKIIHQIWLGSPFPAGYQHYQESWRRLHPDWEYRLWTDADVAAFKLVNQDAFDKGRNFAQKSDIWRYEILERFGGVYVDADFEALQSLDVLNGFCEFYAGMAPISRIALINNAIIGASPHHPILTACVADINKYMKKYPTTTLPSSGPIYFSNKIIEFCSNGKKNNSNGVIVLPSSFLYPIADSLSSSEVEKLILPTTFAVHYWASQWV